ncbi:MAG: ABC transporter substrate-binding protein [Spirochaetales bacterium]|nr:ABC transporter substrate-binding protein [Spirochaetales bacterium]
MKQSLIALFLLCLIACTDTIYIGVALPLSGSKANRGTDILQALELRVEQINSAGGMEGRRIELVVKDDKSDKEAARQVAAELGADERVQAVIGHYDNSMALAARPEYEKAGLVVYSPAAGAPEFTSGSDFTFSGTYSDALQAENIAVYVQNVLEAKTVVVLASDEVHGVVGARAFTARAGRIGLNYTLRSVAEAALAGNGADVVVILSHADTGQKALRELRDSGYSGTILISDRASTDIIEKLDLKYKKDTLISFPFMYDLADFVASDFLRDYQKRYGKEPSVWAAFAIDGLQILSRAAAGGKGRSEVLNALKTMQNKDSGGDGLTGKVFFDKEGSAVRSATVVRFSTPGDMFKPLYDQLKIVSDEHNLRQVDKKVKAGEFLLADGVPYFKIKVVYVGMDYSRVNSIRPKEQSFDMEFFLWFRWTGDFNPEDLVIVNAIGDVNRAPLREDLSRPDRYQAFKVRAEFRHPFNLRRFPFDEQELPITIAHRNRNADKLVLVADRERIREYPVKEIYPEEYLYLGRKEAGGTFTIYSVFGNPGYRANERQADFSQFHSSLLVRRDITPYLITLFFPLAIIFIIALFSFLINKEDFQERLNLFMTALLTVVVFQMAQGAEMPRLGYPVMADFYFLISYGVLFLFILKTLYVNYRHRREPESSAIDVLDKRSDLLFIAVGLIAFTVISLIGFAG